MAEHLDIPRTLAISLGGKMKSLIAAAIVIVGTSAWACPSLEGDYVCKGEFFDKQIKITKLTEDNVFVFSVNGREIRADGEIRKYEQGEDETLYKGYYRAACKDAELRTLVVADILHFGETLEGDLRMAETMSLNSEGSLLLGTHKILRYMTGKSEVVETEETCSRK